MRRMWVAGAALAVMIGVWPAPGRCGEATRDRPKAWAQAVKRPGAPNFFRVTKALYRGAQPSAEGMRELKKMGIRTVVNLRSFHSDRDELGDTGMGYEHITMKAWHAEDKEVVRFLRIVTDKQRTPVFVHCQHGSDRTGTMVAIYRVAVCRWSKDEAIREMIEGGFGFHTVWRGLPEYIRGLDIQAMRRAAGIAERVEEGGAKRGKTP